MKTLFTIVALLGLATAAPFKVVRTRKLSQRNVNSTTGCPRDLPAGNFDYPHLIVPISASNPNTAYGNSLFGVFTPGDIGSIFNFDIPASRANQTCTLEFLFPSQPQLTTSNYTYSGGGSFFFTGYAAGSGASLNTTYNNQPPAGPYPPFPPIHMEPGNAYTIDVGPCAAGGVVSGLTYTNDTTFIYFQDYNPCPIGLYVAYSG